MSVQVHFRHVPVSCARTDFWILIGLGAYSLLQVNSDSIELDFEFLQFLRGNLVNALHVFALVAKRIERSF